MADPNRTHARKLNIHALKDHIGKSILVNEKGLPLFSIDATPFVRRIKYKTDAPKNIGHKLSILISDSCRTTFMRFSIDWRPGIQSPKSTVPATPTMQAHSMTNTQSEIIDPFLLPPF
eukprot:CAMPEP_0167743890 /NCGR_PEP_ID=MMETSP0110_2-20121227/2267_1 /TAXON_ID=629695 /ORGANISM="Gymnochlora sp., Strain CCMP2014" /LENGTH=117 /DNA_ID=CAMNT_0007628311 /DNA_START=625 /DNA_END=975 /DNA_ORIENTATION=-